MAARRDLPRTVRGRPRAASHSFLGSRPGAPGRRRRHQAPCLKLVAERPRSTQELAPLIGISDAGLSKHLRALADAGLVSSKREGYYVLYSVIPDRIAGLSDALASFVLGAFRETQAGRPVSSDGRTSEARTS